MKKLIVFAFALTLAGATAIAQEPVKKAQEPKKIEKKCCSDKKDAAHKCSGECKNHKDAKKVEGHKCNHGAKDAAHKCNKEGKKLNKTAHKCTGKCDHHKKDLKKADVKKAEIKK